MKKVDTLLYSCHELNAGCVLFNIFHVSETCDSENSHRLLSHRRSIPYMWPNSIEKRKNNMISWNQSRVPRAQCLEISLLQNDYNYYLKRLYLFIWIMNELRRLRFKTCGNITFYCCVAFISGPHCSVLDIISLLYFIIIKRKRRRKSREKQQTKKRLNHIIIKRIPDSGYSSVILS